MQIDLCVPCMEKLKSDFTLRRIKGGTGLKITCAQCQRRRYGATYEVTQKSPKEGVNGQDSGDANHQE